MWLAGVVHYGAATIQEAFPGGPFGPVVAGMYPVRGS